MKSIQGILLNFIGIGLLSFFSSCGGDTPMDALTDEGKLEALEKEAPSHQLDTTIGYCYQVGEKEIQEAFELKIKGNRVKGFGYRLYIPLQKSYELFIDGVIEDNKIHVNIRATNSHEAGESFLQTETWELSEKNLIVKNRAIENMTGDFTYHRIACQVEKNKDTTRYDSFSGFVEGYAVVSKNGRLGLVNEKWEVTIPLIYRSLGVVSEGSIMYYDHEENRKGLLDVNGNILVLAKYAEIQAYNEGLAAFLSDEGKWGFMDRDQKVVIKPIYTNINFFQPDPNRHPFYEGLANVQGANGFWNYINPKGEVVIAGNFLFTESFKNGKARVYKDNKWYFINKAGKCIENCDE